MSVKARAQALLKRIEPHDRLEASCLYDVYSMADWRMLTDLAAEGRFNCAVDCQSGFALQKWVARCESLPIFNDCMEENIEVFWTRDRR